MTIQPDESRQFARCGRAEHQGREGDPCWSDECARCGYARINLRHWPETRTLVVEGPPECEFVKVSAA